jgi:hypothetical protein
MSVSAVAVAEAKVDGDAGADCTVDDADGVGVDDGDDGGGVDGAGVDGTGVDGVGAGELGTVTTCEKPSRSECVLMAHPPAPIPPTTTAAAVTAAAARRRRKTRDVRSDRSSRSAT